MKPLNKDQLKVEDGKVYIITLRGNRIYLGNEDNLERIKNNLKQWIGFNESLND